MAILSDEAKKLGIAIGYDPNTKNVKVGDRTYTPTELAGAGLTLKDGRWQGDVSQLLQPTQVPLPQTQISAQAPNTTDLARQLADAEKARTIASLKQAYDKTLGTIGQGEQSAIKGQEQVRSGIRTQSAMDAKKFEEFLSQRGLSSSGVAPQGFIQQAGQTQGLLGQSQQAQQDALNKFGMQRADAQGQFEFGQADANAVANMATLQAQIDAQNIADQRAYQESQQAKEYARQDTATANAQEREDFNTQIMANYRDISAFVNKLVSEGAPQWKIDAANAAKVQKVIENNLDPATGRPLAVDNTQAIWDTAYKKWNSGIPLTSQEMQVLGTNTPVEMKSSGGGTSSASQTQMINRWKALGFADGTVAQYFGIPTGARYGEAIIPQQQVSQPTTQQPLTAQSIVQDISSLPQTAAAKQIALWAVSGMLENLSDSDADLVDERMRQLGITDAMLNQAIRDIQTTTQDITVQ